MIFASRAPRRADGLTWTKAVLLVAGAAVFLIGNVVALRWVSWVGLGLLLVAFVMRFMRPSNKTPEHHGDVSR